MQKLVFRSYLTPALRKTSFYDEPYCFAYVRRIWSDAGCCVVPLFGKIPSCNPRIIQTGSTRLILFQRDSGQFDNKKVIHSFWNNERRICLRREAYVK